MINGTAIKSDRILSDPIVALILLTVIRVELMSLFFLFFFTDIKAIPLNY